MLKKVILGFLVLATSALFGMSLSQVNKASKGDLMEINGIGDVKAAAIMKARPFKSFDDLEAVKGVGSQLVANVKGDVKNTSDVKKVKKTTKVAKKTSKTKTKTDKSAKETKKRKIKSVDDKKKELKTKAKKTKAKKTKAKKTKEKKTKTKTK